MHQEALLTDRERRYLKRGFGRDLDGDQFEKLVTRIEHQKRIGLRHNLRIFVDPTGQKLIHRGKRANDPRVYTFATIQDFVRSFR